MFICLLITFLLHVHVLLNFYYMVILLNVMNRWCRKINLKKKENVVIYLTLLLAFIFVVAWIFGKDSENGGNHYLDPINEYSFADRPYQDCVHQVISSQPSDKILCELDR